LKIDVKKHTRYFDGFVVTFGKYFSETVQSL